MGKRLLPIGSALLLLLLGCTSIRELPREQLAAEVKTPEHELCRELLSCFLRNDVQGFVKRLNPETRKNFIPDEFKKTRADLAAALGEPVSFQYLTTLEFVSLSPHIWKIRFRREDKKGKEIFSEALFRIVTGKAADGTVLVLGFNFL